MSSIFLNYKSVIGFCAQSHCCLVYVTVNCDVTVLFHWSIATHLQWGEGCIDRKMACSGRILVKSLNLGDLLSGKVSTNICKRMFRRHINHKVCLLFYLFSIFYEKQYRNMNQCLFLVDLNNSWFSERRKYRGLIFVDG